MPQPEIRSPILAGLGLRAFKGGAVVVGIVLEEKEPRVVLSSVLETGAPHDRVSLEPYRMAADMPPGRDGRASPEAAAIVVEGRRRQDERATEGLQSMTHRLDAAGYKVVVAALLVNRAGWITDLLEYSRAWAEHVPVAETLAVRDALRFAVDRCGIELVEMDEKSLSDVAVQTLSLPSAEMDARLKALGMPVGRPWRKEQKLAGLSAWIALAGRH